MTLLSTSRCCRSVPPSSSPYLLRSFRRVCYSRRSVFPAPRSAQGGGRLRNSKVAFLLQHHSGRFDHKLVVSTLERFATICARIVPLASASSDHPACRLSVTKALDGGAAVTWSVLACASFPPRLPTRRSRRCRSHLHPRNWRPSSCRDPADGCFLRDLLRVRPSSTIPQQRRRWPRLPFVILSAPWAGRVEMQIFQPAPTPRPPPTHSWGG